MALEGVCIAPDDDTLTASPTWLRLDGGPEPFTRVASYTIDRGRQFELDQTDGGRAEVRINDVDGELDPTNTGGTLYTKLEPLMQAGIARFNPVANEWQPRFRGFVETFSYEFDPTQKVNYLSLSLVDIYEILNTTQMRPGTFGDPLPPGLNPDGDVFFLSADVQTRLDQLVGDAGLPTEFFVFFSGNVDVFEATYSPGEPMLVAIQDCADAEFPGVSNFYPDRFGRGCFHGRLAKFDPEGTIAAGPVSPDSWTFLSLHAGDGDYVAGAPSTRAQIREFGFERGTSKVFNSASASHVGMPDRFTPDQLYEDATSIGIRGIRSWSKENLLTMKSHIDGVSWTPQQIATGEAARAECLRFATYIVQNYAEPRNRITQIGFRPVHDLDPRAPAVWQMLCEIDIADRVTVTVGSPGGGGFNAEPYYVEGVHEEVRGRLAGSGGYELDDVTLTLDLSPQAYFTSGNPWEGFT